MDGFLTREKRVLSLFATSDFRPPEHYCTAGTRQEGDSHRVGASGQNFKRSLARGHHERF
jgi:hypothetical protein